MLAVPLMPAAPPAPFDPRWIEDVTSPSVSRSYLFGSFLLQPERQLLMNGAEPVRIGGRALDLLTALVERPGELIGKQELLARVWPRIFVDEANLRANMAILRRALGERHAGPPRFIATIVGRGYRFIGSVRTIGARAGCGHCGAGAA